MGPVLVRIPVDVEVKRSVQRGAVVPNLGPTVCKLVGPPLHLLETLGKQAGRKVPGIVHGRWWAVGGRPRIGTATQAARGAKPMNARAIKSLGWTSAGRRHGHKKCNAGGQKNTPAGKF